MIRFLMAFLVVATVISCKPGIPKDIVQPNQMEQILYDIHVVDGYVSFIPVPDSAKKITAPIYKGIFKKYGIDSAQHAKSMAYYYQHPDILSKMYDRISERLKKAQEDEAKRVEKEAKRAEKEAKLKAKKVIPIDSAVEVKPDTAIKSIKSTKSVENLKSVKNVKVKPLDTLQKAKFIKQKNKFKNASQSVQ